MTPRLRAALVALILAPTIFADARGGEGTERAAIARWLFNGNGSDEAGAHPVTLHGDATFVLTCESVGLLAGSAGAHGTYPPLDQVPNGTISFRFELQHAFGADASYANPIVIINSNRPGHLVGDMSVRLDPTDGKLWFVMEHPVVSSRWLLKSTKSHWEPGVCYLAEIEWGPTGRSMKVTSPDYFEWNADEEVRAYLFSADATLTTVLSRASDSPPTGVKLDWLEVAAPPPPVATAITGWGRLKSLYR